MNVPSLNTVITEALSDVKGENIVAIDVTGVSDVADTLIICSGSSGRQVKSLANNVVEESKKHGFMPIGVEGMEGGEWVLVDFGSTVVHVMLPTARQYYELEKLWSLVPPNQIPVRP
jgi:ribosome-associated protein